LAVSQIPRDDPRPALRESLRRWAESKGRPLDELIEEIKAKEGPLTTEEKLVLSDHFRSLTLKPYTTDSAAEIRAMRETDCR
jgi:hypothetical protein